MTTTSTSSARGWVVTLAATGIGLALGILYAWSVIKGGIPESWGWSNAHKALPYSVACLLFALSMVPAGRLQDRIGPRWVATIGGLLTGLGCIVSGLSGSSLAGFIAGFGVLSGVGIGFGYSAMTPAAIKWFPPNRTGLITGIVVAGFGMASVYIAPLSSWLLTFYQKTTPAGVVEKGVSSTMITFGVAFLVIVTVLSQLIRNPEAPKAASAAKASVVDVPWGRMLRSAQFWVLYAMFFCGAGAGLMFISVAQDLGKRSLGEWAFFAVAVLAVGNAGGRILAGVLSDKIGRQWTMFGSFVCQGAIVGVLYWLSQGGSGAGWPLTLLVVCLLGLNYGSNLSLFPAASKDYFGLKSFGMNYGMLFTSWGAAGLILPWLNGKIKDATGSSDLSFFIIIGMMIGAALLSFVSRRLGRPAVDSSPAPAQPAAPAIAPAKEG
jgi:MFS transporter, OFA family, oxalate/formate antiporter